MSMTIRRYSECSKYISKGIENAYVITVSNCQMYFNFDMPSTLWSKRVRTFNVKFSASNVL